MLNSSIPAYNKFRVRTPQQVDTDDMRGLFIQAPSSVIQYILGSISLNNEPNYWQEEDGHLTAAQMVDIFNNDVIIEQIAMGNFCELVAGCINNSLVVQEAIQNQSASDQVYQQYPDDDTRDAVIDGLDCVWGGAIGLTSYLRDEVDRILDIFDAALDAVEAARDWFGDTTRIGRFFAQYDTVFSIMEIVGVVGTTALRLQNTQTLAEELACDLFCKVQAAGEPYILTREIWEQWKVDNFFGAFVTIRGFLNAMIIGIELPNFLGGRLPILSERELYTRYQLSADDSCSNDWQILCTACPSVLVIDFTQDDGLFSPVVRAGWTGSAGLWVGMEGWMSQQYVSPNNAYDQGVDITRTFSNFFCERIEIDVDRQQGSTLGGTRSWRINFDGVTYGGSFANEPSGTYEATVNATGSIVNLSARGSFNVGSNGGGEAVIKQVRIFYTGTPPS